MNLIFTSFPLFKDTLPLLDSEGMSLLYAMMGKNDYTDKEVAYLKGTTAANTLFAAVIFSSKDREGQSIPFVSGRIVVERAWGPDWWRQSRPGATPSA